MRLSVAGHPNHYGVVTGNGAIALLLATLRWKERDGVVIGKDVMALSLAAS